MSVGARRGNRIADTLFLSFDIYTTTQGTNSRGRVGTFLESEPYDEARFCVAELNAKDMEAYHQKQLDVDHILVSRGGPKAKRLDVLVQKANENRRFRVESVEDPGLCGEYTLYYCKAVSA